MEIKNPMLLNDEQDTIIALCSPRGSGAIAILRLSGQNALTIANHMAKLSSNNPLATQTSHTIHHGYVVTNQQTDAEIIDEVLFLIMKAPKTFTGQDTVEINCHNNPFIINQIIECAINHGAREAKPGEFTKRAYLNGKIDLLQAEAINDLIHAQSEAALKASLSQKKGSLSQLMHSIEQEILMLLTLTEASFEFLEEEQQDIALHEMLNNKMAYILNTITSLKDQFNKQHVIRDGIRIAIIGNVNAGKSTLFNALANKNRAIISNIAGTTRDSIEYSIVQDGIFWQLIDTAGLRTTDDIIEQQGIERSLDEAKTADIILLVCDGSIPLQPEEKAFYKNVCQTYDKKIILVINKQDLVTQASNDLLVRDGALHLLTTIGSIIPTIQVSSKENYGISELKNLIKDKINHLFNEHTSPYLLNQRHMILLTTLENKLKGIASGSLESLEYELVAYLLRDILEDIAEITGKNASEKILTTVFSTFCIGK